jgi:mannose-6-phosphate isomerase
LREWLIGDACPLWAAAGIDWEHGGFHETLDLTGTPTGIIKRARVAPRQIFAFSRAHDLGWQGKHTDIIEHGLSFIDERFLRADGLYRSSVYRNGELHDNQALLYDQAFMLLAFAEAERSLGAQTGVRQAAESLRTKLLTTMRHGSTGFRPSAEPSAALLSNPNMHLLEAALAWMELDADPVWQSIADDIGTLALTRLAQADRPGLREHFADDWTPIPGLAGRIIEPGHQFEWAWLLLRWRPDDPAVRGFARRLIDFTLGQGIRGGCAINAILDDFNVHDAKARLWPQAEWIKALVAATAHFGADLYEAQLIHGVEALTRYLATPLAGLWYDTCLANGLFEAGPAPASNFYHIVSAIDELARVCLLPGERGDFA